MTQHEIWHEDQTQRRIELVQKVHEHNEKRTK